MEPTGLGLLALSPPGWGGNLLKGLVLSLQIAFGAYALGLTIGLFGALGKIYGGPITRWSLEIYTTLGRAIPELVLILLLFYAGPDIVNGILESFGYERIDINALVAGIYVLGMVQGAYSIEVMRGAMLAVPKGQVEAAKASGMSWTLMHRRIIVPAMIPLALPGLANLWLIATKDTALLAVVGLSELALTTRQAAGATKEYLMFYLAAGFIYLCVSLISGGVFKRLDRRFRRGQADLSG
ncbi:MAG: polar amino acid transport system permease protein [Saprospiraceae bacterium]|jgi:polar amino acid transport system permease protein